MNKGVLKDNFLPRILRHKEEQVAALKRRSPLANIKSRLRETAPAADFRGALRRPGEVALIAEVKGRSPSRGVIRADFDPMAVVDAYRKAGANAVSVLTDRKFFGGDRAHLSGARGRTDQPLLRKDFIIDAYQIYESRLLGADAVLLLAGVLEDPRLREFVDLTRQLGMTALVETRSPGEIRRALAAGALVIGINNRDLQSFKVDLNTTPRLLPLVDDPGVIVVSESGIKTRSQVEALGSRGVHAVLVGETLMAARDLQAAVSGLRGCPRSRLKTGAPPAEQEAYL